MAKAATARVPPSEFISKKHRRLIHGIGKHSFDGGCMLQEVPSCEYLLREGHIMTRVGCTFAVVPFYCVVLGNSIFLFYREKVNLFNGINLCRSIIGLVQYYTQFLEMETFQRSKY